MFIAYKVDNKKENMNMNIEILHSSIYMQIEKQIHIGAQIVNAQCEYQCGLKTGS